MVRKLDIEQMDRIRGNPDSSNPDLLELRDLIIQLLPIGIKGMSYESLVSSNMLECAAEQAIKDVLRLQVELDCDDQFLPTVLKFAVRHLLYDVRYQEWKSKTKVEGIPAVPIVWRVKLAANPALNYVHTIFREELNENQRIAIRSMVMFRVPKEDVMIYLGMERCDYFEMIHNARIRIKQRLQIDAAREK